MQYDMRMNIASLCMCTVLVYVSHDQVKTSLRDPGTTDLFVSIIVLENTFVFEFYFDASNILFS